MNNSDHHDFNEWQDGEENEVPFEKYPPPRDFKPNTWFFYNKDFKKMWEEMQQNKGMEELADYLNISDLFKKQNFPEPKKPQSKKSQKKTTVVNFTQDEYMKLIEIRGYLAITEQFAHVKALDKVLNQIKFMPIPKD